MKERLITTSTWPQLEKGLVSEERKVLDRVYGLKNQLAEVQGVLDCLLGEPVTMRDKRRLATLQIEKTRLAAEISQQVARVRELEQGSW